MSFNPLSLVTGQFWKFATAGAGIISLVLISLLMTSYFENRELTSAKTILTQRIEDPKTGYVAQLAQAHTNVETLKAAIVHERLVFKQKADADNTKLMAAEAALVVAQEQTKSMSAKLAHFLSTKPQGDTLDARVRDIDARALSELIK